MELAWQTTLPNEPTCFTWDEEHGSKQCDLVSCFGYTSSSMSYPNMSTPGSLNWLALQNRPDIAWNISMQLHFHETTCSSVSPFQAHCSICSLYFGLFGMLHSLFTESKVLRGTAITHGDIFTPPKPMLSSTQQGFPHECNADNGTQRSVQCNSNRAC
eukprot:2949321-Amphidinium_carterae.1